MYIFTKNGIFKKLETWVLTIPIFYNSGEQIPQDIINEIFESISVNYPGYTMVNSFGLWKSGQQTYGEENRQIIIDTIVLDSVASARFFKNLKIELCKKLLQEKIYVTRTNQKEEFLTFEEFFDELGLEYNINTAKNTLKIAKDMVNSQEYVLRRLKYETLSLKRDIATKTIIWKRRICGIKLRSEFKDNIQEDAILVAADQMDQFAEALFRGKMIMIVGHYEFEGYILEKFAYRPLVEASVSEAMNDRRYYDQQGIQIDTKRFIELFSMSVFCNYMILRDENYLSKEIKINVGSDGSLQIGENPEKGNTLYHCPAFIPNVDVQNEIIRCINNIINMYESNELDDIGLLQTKARNNYIKKRGILRQGIRNRDI